MSLFSQELGKLDFLVTLRGDNRLACKNCSFEFWQGHCIVSDFLCGDGIVREAACGDLINSSVEIDQFRDNRRNRIAYGIVGFGRNHVSTSSDGDGINQVSKQSWHYYLLVRYYIIDSENRSRDHLAYSKRAVLAERAYRERPAYALATCHSSGPARGNFAPGCERCRHVDCFTLTKTTVRPPSTLGLRRG